MKLLRTWNSEFVNSWLQQKLLQWCDYARTDRTTILRNLVVRGLWDTWN